MFTVQELEAASPKAHVDIITAIVRDQVTIFPKYNITSRNRMLGFMSVAYEESGGFTVLSEDLNYSAARAHVVFPFYFPTIEAAEPYAYQPEKFADKVYGGRMGNRPGTDDGWLYRGQGPIQTTGRNNFAALAKVTGLPLLSSPAMTTSNEHLLECAVALFVMFQNILTYCDQANWHAVWAEVGSGKANGEVINLQNHMNALSALQRNIPI